MVHLRHLGSQILGFFFEVSAFHGIPSNGFTFTITATHPSDGREFGEVGCVHTPEMLWSVRVLGR